MGSVLSLLFGNGSDEEPLSLLELLALVEEQRERPPNEDGHPPPPPIWPRIQRRLAAYPEEAAAYCHNGSEASPSLRVLLLQQPPREQQQQPPVAVPFTAIQALVEAYDVAVFHADRNGTTPLMAAVQRQSLLDHEEALHSVQLLLQLNPQAVSQADKTGKIPLHFCRHKQVAQRLISETGEDDTVATHPALVPDKTGIRPLDSLCEDLEQALLQSQQSQDEAPAPGNISTSTNAYIERLWQVLTLLVQSAMPDFNCGSNQEDKFLMVHAIVAAACPAVVVAEALRRFPQQAVQRDQTSGRTPLLIAVGLLQESTTTVDKNDHNDGKSKHMDSQDNRNKHHGNMTATICELLKFNPTAARMTDHEGRVAIDVLAEAGVYDVQLFEALVMAEPRAVDTRDLKNRLHPFLSAACGAGNFQSVYHLLREKPHVVQTLLDYAMQTSSTNNGGDTTMH